MGGTTKASHTGERRNLMSSALRQRSSIPHTSFRTNSARPTSRNSAAHRHSNTRSVGTGHSQ